MNRTPPTDTAAPPPELVAMSAHLGADPLLIQGAGGNTSAKVADTLWVKASGKWLETALREPIFAAVDLADIRARIAAGESDVLPKTPGAAPALRPSIETTLHALMPHRIVAHVHSVNALAWAVRADAQARLAERLAGLRWVFVPYVRPGVPLTYAVADALKRAPADVLLMGNHGLVVGGADRAAVEKLLADVEARLALAPRPESRFDRAALERLGAAHGFTLPHFEIVHAIATDPVNLRVAAGGSLYPDHVVFLGPGALAVDPGDDLDAVIRARTDRGWPRPKLVLVRGLGVLVEPGLSAGAEEMARCLALVVMRVEANAKILYLTPAQDAELLDWDAEKFRQAVS